MSKKTSYVVGLVLVVPVLVAASVFTVEARELTFEQRVEAQRAIERVYYSHQTGAIRRFDEVVTREILEGKVRTYLKQSAALEQIWNTPVTAEALQHELHRIASSTRLPGRLREVYAALDEDAFVVQECFVRAVLVDRLARSFFAFDDRFHDTSRAEAVEIRRRLTNVEMDPRTEEPHRAVVEISRVDTAELRQRGVRETLLDVKEDTGVTSVELAADEFPRWRAQLPAAIGEVGATEEERDAFVIRVILEENADRVRVASYTVQKVAWDEWWARTEDTFDGTRIRCTADPRSALPQPASGSDRTWEAAVASGQAPILSAESSTTSVCGNPDDTWEPTALDDPPEKRVQHSAVWTGSLMLVWGGWNNSFLNSGGRYDPLTDVWKPTSQTGGPVPRSHHTAVWTGSQMVIWGGSDSEVDPVSLDTDLWRIRSSRRLRS